MPKIYIIAGEPSGDQLGKTLMKAIKKQKRSASFAGVGGEKMQDAGLQSLFNIEEISVMGLTEVLPHIFSIKQRINQTVDHIIEEQPDVLVTIDAPGFCHRVIQKLKARKFDVPKVHYVAPTVWAWKPGRAKKLARLVDHLMVLLPFEPPFFEAHGLKTTFVGHPAVKGKFDQGDKATFLKKYDIPRNKDVITLLPGSRKKEIQTHLPVFESVAKKLYDRNQDCVFVIPALHVTQDLIEDFIKDWKMPTKVILAHEDKVDCYAASQLALATSGTVSVELGAAHTPQVIAYKMSWLTFQFIKRLVKVRYASLINILQDRDIVPEFIQNDCEPQKIYMGMLDLMEDSQAVTKQLTGVKKSLDMLSVDETYPGKEAARVVLEYIN